MGQTLPLELFNEISYINGYVKEMREGNTFNWRASNAIFYTYFTDWLFIHVLIEGAGQFIFVCHVRVMSRHGSNPSTLIL